MIFKEADRLTWNGRTGIAIAVNNNRHNGHGYVRLLMDDVRLPYWVEYNYLAFAGLPSKPGTRIRNNHVRTEAA